MLNPFHKKIIHCESLSDIDIDSNRTILRYGGSRFVIYPLFRGYYHFLAFLGKLNSERSGQGTCPTSEKESSEKGAQDIAADE
jgi:hypothetical protein